MSKQTIKMILNEDSDDDCMQQQFNDQEFDDQEFNDQEQENDVCDQENDEPEVEVVLVDNVAEEVYREEVPDSWEDVVDEEVTKVEVTKEEPKIEVTKEEKENKDLVRKYEEVMAWATKIGVAYNEIPGSLQEKYEEMIGQLELQAKKFAQKEAQEAKSRAEKGAVARGVKRVFVPRVGKNQQNKEDKGVVKVWEKKVKEGPSRRERKQTRDAKNPITIVAKPVIVEQIKLEEADEADQSSEETEDETPIMISTRAVEEMVPEPIVAEAPMEDGWEAVKLTKKGERTKNKKIQSKKDDEQMIKLSLMGLSKPKVPEPKVPESKEVSQEKTRMCQSFATGKACPHGSHCRFAHKVEELRSKQCRYGENCRHIRIKDGAVTNNASSNMVCQYWHTNEKADDYLARMGIKKPVQKEIKPVQIQLAPVRSAVPVKLAPWASQPAKEVVRKTRWGPPLASTPINIPSVPVVTEIPTIPRKSRWGPQMPVPPIAPTPPFGIPAITMQELPVIQVPKALFQQTMQMLEAQGILARVIAV